MGTKKKTIQSVITVHFLCAALFVLCAFTTFRGETGESGANVVSTNTPIHAERGGTIWTRSFSSDDGKTVMNSEPVIVEEGIYLVSKDQLYLLNFSGDVVKQMTLSTNMCSTCHLLLEKNELYIPLAGGIIECVDVDTFTSKWQSDVHYAQSLSTLTYHEGYLYAGTTIVKNSSTSGMFYCLNAGTGQTVWTYEDEEHPGGYYWSGGLVHGNAIYFSGDHGMLVSHSLTTDEVYDVYVLSEDAQIRAGLTYDSENDALYTVSNDGRLYKIEVEEDGKIKDVNSNLILSSAKYMNCTSTPTIYNNRLYIGCSADSYGYLVIVRADTLDTLYSVKGRQYAEVKSSPLVSCAYASEENHQKVYVYVTFNAPPGGIYMLEDDETKNADNIEDVVFDTLFEPAVAKQYCLASIVSDSDGILYYSNDSGTFFAVSEVDVSSDAGEQEEISASSSSPTPDVEPGVQTDESKSSGQNTASQETENSTAAKEGEGKGNSKPNQSEIESNTASSINQATDRSQTKSKETKLKLLTLSSVSAKSGKKKITGKVSVSKANVKIKVGKKSYKKAVVKGKKFELKVSKLKKKTKITVKVIKKGYQTLKKSYKVK